MYLHNYICLYDDTIINGEYITSNDSATGELEEISKEVFILLWYCPGVCEEGTEKSTTYVSQGQYHGRDSIRGVSGC